MGPRAGGTDRASSRSQKWRSNRRGRVKCQSGPSRVSKAADPPGRAPQAAGSSRVPELETGRLPHQDVTRLDRRRWRAPSCRVRTRAPRPPRRQVAARHRRSEGPPSHRASARRPRRASRCRLPGGDDLARSSERNGADGSRRARWGRGGGRLAAESRRDGCAGVQRCGGGAVAIQLRRPGRRVARERCRRAREPPRSRQSGSARRRGAKRRERRGRCFGIGRTRTRTEAR
jgi:hypothetical protein